MTQTNIDIEISKGIIEKIENELLVLKSFKEIIKDKEENTDFIIFHNETQVGNKIYEEILEMQKIITQIYDKIHDLNQHTTIYLNNNVKTPEKS